MDDWSESLELAMTPCKNSSIYLTFHAVSFDQMLIILSSTLSRIRQEVSAVTKEWQEKSKPSS